MFDFMVFRTHNCDWITGKHKISHKWLWAGVINSTCVNAIFHVWAS